MPRCLELATEEPARLLNPLTQQYDDFIAAVLRGETPAWSAGKADPDPSEFLQRCDYHGVSALLYHQASEQPEWRNWPEQARDGLWKSSKAGVAQDLLRSHFLDELLQAFEHQQVRCLLTKGEALALSHYDTPGTRSRCDSDLFIPATKIEIVRSIASGMGLETVSTVYKSHQFTLRRVQDSPDAVQFDVHWRIQNAARYARFLSFEEAFDEASPMPGKTLARTLRAADALMLACVHRVGSEGHDRDRLIWAYDMHVLVNSMSPGELEQFADRAVGKNVQAACLDGLDWSRNQLGTDIPPTVMEKLKTPEAPRTVPRRFAESNLGLLADDLKVLKAAGGRQKLLRELFLPAPEELLAKYDKHDDCWLPWLYLRQWFSGIAQRLMLR